MEEVMLTTIDNPFNPFTQFDEWYQFDEEKGYHTCGYLARIMKSSFELSEEEEDRERLEAINEIIRINPFGVHKKVTMKDFESTKAS